MKIEEMWTKARRRNGFCIVCETALEENEDFAVCDKCWPEEEEEGLE